MYKDRLFVYTHVQLNLNHLSYVSWSHCCIIIPRCIYASRDVWITTCSIVTIPSILAQHFETTPIHVMRFQFSHACNCILNVNLNVTVHVRRYFLIPFILAKCNVLSVRIYFWEFSLPSTSMRHFGRCSLGMRVVYIRIWPVSSGALKLTYMHACTHQSRFASKT